MRLRPRVQGSIVGVGVKNLRELSPIFVVLLMCLLNAEQVERRLAATFVQVEDDVFIVALLTLLSDRIEALL